MLTGTRDPRYDGKPVPAVAWMVVVLAMAAFLGGLQLHDSHYFLWDDNAAYFLPVYVYDAETLAGTGELAHWNPHQYLGKAHLASGQSGVLYPPVYLAHALAVGITGDPRATIDVLASLHLLAAAFGMLWLLRRGFGLPASLAVLAALAWGTAPFAWIVGRSWIFVPYAAAWLPWSMLAFLSLLRRPGARRSIVFAVVHAFFFLQGYVQYLVLAAVYQGVYLTARTALAEAGSARERLVGWLRDTFRLAVGWLFAAAFAAPLLGPMLHAKEVSAARAEPLSLEEFLSNALDLGLLLRAQVFDMASHAVHRSTGAIYYLGLPLLLAAGWVLLAAVRRDRTADRRRGLSALLAAAVAVVLSTEAVSVLHAVPLLGSFRWPFKSFLFVGFFLVLAAGVGLGDAWRRGGRPRILAVTCLVLTLAGNLGVLLTDSWDRPFGPNRLERSVGSFRAETAERISTQKGRVVSMWMSHGQEGIERFLTHDYATLAGAYHLGGYDPLVAERNFRLAKGLEYSNIWRYELSTSSLAYLSSWSVRYVLVPDRPHVPELMARFPALRPIHSEDDLRVYENARALPFAYFLESVPGDDDLAAPEIRFGPRGVGVRTAGRGGHLRLQVAPLPWMEWWADGEAMGPIEVDGELHPVLRVPEGTQSVEVRYVDRPFRIGVGVAALALLLAAWWMLREGAGNTSPRTLAPRPGTRNSPRPPAVET